MLEQVKTVLTILSVWDRVKKLWDFSKKISASGEQGKDINSVANRFICLFEKHGVHRNQIPRFFGHGLTLEDVANPDKLLSKLTRDILQAACELFAVRLEWLEGADEQIYEIHHFYKQPGEYAEFIANLAAYSEHRIRAKLVLSTWVTRGEDALIILEEQIGEMGNETVVRYHLCSGWVSKYWKSRADLTACIAITLKQMDDMKNRWTPSNIETFCNGQGFIADLYQLPLVFERDKFFRRQFKNWHPDQWVYDPKSYLEGVDEGDFGKASALAEWIYYFDKGYMETGYHRENPRARFATELEKYH